MAQANDLRQSYIRLAQTKFAETICILADAAKDALSYGHVDPELLDWFIGVMQSTNLKSMNLKSMNLRMNLHMNCEDDYWPPCSLDTVKESIAKADICMEKAYIALDRAKQYE
jgi:hypothetical protein